MRRPLGMLPALALAALLLTACGDDAAGPAADPAPERTTESTPTTPTPTAPTLKPGEADHTVVALEHATAVGGTTENLATRVGPGEEAATAGFLAQFEDPVFRQTVEERITSSQAEGDLYAAVVAVGCDVPDGVAVSTVPGGYAVAADKIAKPTPECFAPVTTVAVVAIRG